VNSSALAGFLSVTSDEDSKPNLINYPCFTFCSGNGAGSCKEEFDRIIMMKYRRLVFGIAAMRMK
jgi:hypothetical protein